MQIEGKEKKKSCSGKRYILALCQFQLQVYTRVGRVSEIAPNPEGHQVGYQS
jgi:hypothetical protein